MKKKFLLLSSLIASTNLLTVVSCTQSTKTIFEPKLIIPNSYNLNSELWELNQLDFKNRNLGVNLKNYHFLNSWFLNFETTNQNQALFEGNKIGQKKLTLPPAGRHGYSNGPNHQIWTARTDTNFPIWHKNWDELVSISSILDLNQTFQVYSDDFDFGQWNTLFLTNQPKFVDYDKTFFHLIKQEFRVAPFEEWHYYYQISLYLNKIEGLLKFSLNQKTKIAYQVENNLTQEKSIYSYSVSDLIEKYFLDHEYQKLLSNKKGFLYYHPDTKFFNMQIEAQFNLLDDFVEDSHKIWKTN